MKSILKMAVVGSVPAVLLAACGKDEATAPTKAPTAVSQPATEPSTVPATIPVTQPPFPQAVKGVRM